MTQVWLVLVGDIVVHVASTREKAYAAMAELIDRGMIHPTAYVRAYNVDQEHSQ